MDFPSSSVVKNLPANAETRVQPLGREDQLDKEMAICFSILTWEIPQTEEPGALQSMRPQRVGHDLVTEQHIPYKYFKVYIYFNIYWKKLAYYI